MDVGRVIVPLVKSFKLKLRVEKVEFEGPYGTFTASRTDVRRPLVLIGGGVGITPIRAMIEDLPPHTSVDHFAKDFNGTKN